MEKFVRYFLEAFDYKGSILSKTCSVDSFSPELSGQVGFAEHRFGSFDYGSVSSFSDSILLRSPDG